MENPHLPKLQELVSKAPVKPGVYRWLNDGGEVLYVGKAKQLRNRLRNYVSPAKDSSGGVWKAALVSKIADLEYTVTATELEALILETNLIKELRPKYNVLMKDDKNYVYVRISIKDPFPAVSVVRRLEDDSAKYFGPYLKKFQIDHILELLHDVFPYRTSKQILETMNRRARDGQPVDEAVFGTKSWECQIGKHCALGFGDYTQAQYRSAIEEIIRFFRGDHSEIKAAFRQQMQEAAMDKKFERAAKLRDGLAYIESLEEQQTASDTTGANTDAIGVALQSDKVQMVVLQERGGKLIGEYSFALAGQAESVAAALAQFIPQYYQTVTDFPDTVLIGTELAESSVLAELLSSLHGKKVELHQPERGKKNRLLDMAQRNADDKVRQQLAKWEAVQQAIDKALAELQDRLKLPEPPKRIEGYDISHLGGTETVGSMVVTKNGKAANADYRSFTIRTLQSGMIDDYAALAEVLRRRLLHLVRNIREEEQQWSEQGIQIGKARKAEQETITTLVSEHKLGSADGLSYKDCLVARSGDEIVALARLWEHSKLTELDLIWVQPEWADKNLHQFVARKLLAGVKKGKVYAVLPPADEPMYTDMGFRYLHTAPEELQAGDRLAMVWLATDNKTDPSLSSRPDLIMIDGGKGQLSAVVAVLKDLQLDIPVIGLAKREEEVFLPGEKVSLLFEKDSPGRYMLMRLRDEAHRFANRHREKRLANKAYASALDSVPGIGEKTRQELLREFGDIAGITAASDVALRKIVNEKQLAALRSSLN